MVGGGGGILTCWFSSLLKKKLHSQAATGGRTRIDLTQYSATPLVFVTAHNPTGPIFPMVINATSAGFYIWSLDKTYVRGNCVCTIAA